MGIATSQLHTCLGFFEFEGFLQSKLQRAATVRQRSVRNVYDVLFHTSDRLRVLEGRNQKLALHLSNLLLAEKSVSSTLRSSSKLG